MLNYLVLHSTSPTDMLKMKEMKTAPVTLGASETITCVWVRMHTTEIINSTAMAHNVACTRPMEDLFI